MARKRVIDVTTATRTLSRNENGSIVVLNRGAGITVTLPSAGRGLEFQFVVKASGAYTIDAGTDKIRGALLQSENNVASRSFTANPASHVKIVMGGATTQTGGLVGTNITLTCDTDGIWTASGSSVATTAATATTPFTT